MAKAKKSKIKNKILIVVDALREDVLWKMPFLSSFAKENIYYEGAFSTCPFTAGSIAGYLGGVYPISNDAGYCSPFPAEFKLLQEEFIEKGYKAFCFHSNPYLDLGFNRGWSVWRSFEQEVHKKSFVSNLSGYLLKRFGPGSVFFRMVLWAYLKTKPRVEVPYTRSEVILKEAEKYLSEKGYFMYVHLMDLHWPYIPPKKFTDLNENEISKTNLIITKDLKHVAEKNVDGAKALYEGCARYVDLQLKEFFKKIDFRTTEVYVTSDHGDCFGEGCIGHLPYLNDVLLHVPLIKSGRKRVVKEEVSLINLKELMFEKQPGKKIYAEAYWKYRQDIGELRINRGEKVKVLKGFRRDGKWEIQED